MEDFFPDHLSLQAKEQLVRSKGRFVEGQDYYSYRILFYILGDECVELTYDFSNQLVGVDLVDKNQTPSHLISELESRLEERIAIQRNRIRNKFFVCSRICIPIPVTT